MIWYEWFAAIAVVICLFSCAFHFYRIISLGKAPEYSRRSGHLGKAIKYSFTGAMSPKVKESAYLHLPTYTAGILYHLGTFLAIFLFFIILLKVEINSGLSWGIAAFLVISGLSGLGILVKRLAKHELRSLSNPDDYISNILVTIFQLCTALIMLYPGYLMVYFIAAGILLLYFPMGKLKHAVYFFAARYHLGVFYGWRDVWPPKPIKK